MNPQVVCPGCGQRVAIRASLSNQEVRCPHCRHIFAPAIGSSPEVAGPAASNPFLRPRPRPETKPEPKVDSKLLLAGALLIATIFLPLSLYLAVRLSRAPAAPVAARPAETAADSPAHAAVLSGTYTANAQATPGPNGPSAAASLPATVAPPPMPQPPANIVAGPTMPPTSPPLPPAGAPGTGDVAANVAASPPQPPAPTVAPAPLLPMQGSATELVTVVEPSVVVVDVGRGLGSGFVYDELGTIVTNYHVIEGAKKAVVRFADQSTADVTGYLVIAPGKDLAILRINTQGRRIKPLRVAAEHPKKAEEVFAFGAPRGLGSTVTNGIVSAVRLGTELRDNFKTMTGVDVYSDHQHYDLDAFWIQTTAPISGGNSGGPLVNRQGEVVGLNTWSRTDGQNLNFAISIEHVKKMMESTQSGVQPLASLPKPRHESHGPAGASEKTLAYWNEIGKINRSLFDRLKHTPRPHVPSPKKRSPGFFVKLSVYYKKVADFLPETVHKLRNLDLVGVDADLVLLATADALQLEQTANDLRKLSIEAEIGRLVHIVDMDQIYKKSYGRFDFVNIGAAYEKTRLILSARYQVQFPNIAADAAAPKKAKTADDDADADGDANREKQAAGKLKLARQ
ncbi:MAG TPA: trypsin-like peptidase domain-containing protein, partial [Pirellulales bacterium]|nr:trypsin-like peptidase domain-containing protein [Pirellulales bacterium]